MSRFGRHTLFSSFLTLSLSLLAACGSTPQSSSDPITDLATLADGDGNLEATIEIQSVGSSSLESQAETLHLYFKASYKGKNLHGFYTLPEVGDEVLVAHTQGIWAAFAKGDRPRIRGRVRSVKGVPAFIGLMRPETAGASAAAATPPAPVVLLAEGKTLPPSTQTAVTLSDLLVSSFFVEIDGVSAGWLRTSDGKLLASVQIVSPRDPASGLPTGKVFQAKLSGQIEVVQSSIGPIARIKGVLTYGQNQSVEVQGYSITEAEIDG